MATQHYINIDHKTVAVDQNGAVREFNPRTGKFGGFAKTEPLVQVAPVQQPAPAQPASTPDLTRIEDGLRLLAQAATATDKKVDAAVAAANTAAQRPVPQPAPQGRGWREWGIAAALALVVIGTGYMFYTPAVTVTLGTVSIGKVADAVAPKVAAEVAKGNQLVIEQVVEKVAKANEAIVPKVAAAVKTAVSEVIPTDLKASFGELNKELERVRIDAQAWSRMEQQWAQLVDGQTKADAKLAEILAKFQAPAPAAPAPATQVTLWSQYDAASRVSRAQQIFEEVCGQVPNGFSGRDAEDAVMAIQSEEDLREKVTGYCQVKRSEVSPTAEFPPRATLAQWSWTPPVRYQDPHRRVDVGPAPRAYPLHVDPRRGPHGPAVRQRCPAGSRPAGELGCIGEPVTDRTKLQHFDKPIQSGCVEGARREVWVAGTMPDGRKVRWKVVQRAVCNRTQS